MIDLEQAAEKAHAVFSGCGRVVAAYLFGSAASGRMRPGSDVDIAVLLDELASGRERKALMEELHAPLCRLFRADVHLLFLNDAPYAVRMEVFVKGRALYVADQAKTSLFRTTSTVLFAEFAPLMRKTRQAFQDRIRSEHGR